MKGEVVRTFRACINEGCRPLADGVIVVPVVLWALNAVYREQYKACLFKVMFEGEPGTPLTTLSDGSEEDSDVA